MYVGRNRCEVTDPDGSVWTEPDLDPAPPAGLVRRLLCTYPVSFPGAPPVVSGTYEIRWLLGTKRGKWRELLRYKTAVNLE